MGFEEELKNFAAKIPEKEKHIDSEALTKQVLIYPLLGVMGYDTTDPTEVKAEFPVDIGAKKSEKVDFAILNSGNPEILIECKKLSLKLNESNISQLNKYFNLTVDARIGVLTNGIEYYFFTDSTRKNMMDEKPFLVIDLKNLNCKDIQELKKFTKEEFTTDVKKAIENEIKSPSNINLKQVILDVDCYNEITSTDDINFLLKFFFKLNDCYDGKRYVFVDVNMDISYTNNLVRVSNKPTKKSDNEILFKLDDSDVDRIWKNRVYKYLGDSAVNIVFNKMIYEYSAVNIVFNKMIYEYSDNSISELEKNLSIIYDGDESSKRDFILLALHWVLNILGKEL